MSIGTLFRLIILVLVINSPAHAADVPQSFTLDGKLFSDSAGNTALEDSSITFTVQILDDAKLCVIYEETQSVSTAASKGYFSIQVGTEVGSPLRTAGDSANSMAQVFQNVSVINGKLLSNGAACTVPAIAAKRRYVRIKILPASMGGVARTLAPDLTIDSVPNSIVAERAETLQGLRANNVLQVNTSGTNQLSQANLESLFTSTTRFNSLTAIVDGTSTSYMRTNSPSGAQLPVMAGAPSSPTPGSIWYDSSDSKLKYQTSVGPIIVGSGSGTVTSVGLSAPSELSVASSPITSSGTIAVTWATQTTNKVFAAPDGSTGTPTFRAMTANDIPNLPWTKITSLLPTTLLGYGITDAVKNNSGVPSMESGLDAAKGAATTAGRIWISTDTKQIYRDNGATWDLIGSGAGGGGSGDFMKDGSVAMTGSLKMGGNTIFGNSTVSGNLTLDSTSDATKGNINLAPSGGKIGIGTTAPTHAMTFGSTANGIVAYNTADQTTNYERVRSRWNSNQYKISTDAGGTGTSREIVMNGTTFGSGTFSGFVWANWLTVGTITGPASGASTLGLSGTPVAIGNYQWPASSGTVIMTDIQANVENSGTAGYTGFRVSAYEQTLGSGANLLMDLGTNSANGATGTHTSKVVVTNTGKVGIGTTTPSYLLEVNGDALFDNHLFVGGNVVLQGGRILSWGNNATIGGGTNYIPFETSGSERVRIDSTGSVGIGTSAPAARLDVTDTGTTTSAIIVPRAGNFTGTAANGMIRYNTASTLFEFRQNGAWVNYTTVSDGRLKKDVEPVVNGLDIVNQLNPVFYNWDRSNPKATSFGDKHEVGFIAQEVERVLPEVVNKGEDSYRSLEYGKMVSVVVAAVKELYQKALGVDREIASLKEKVEKSERENAELKAYLCAKDPSAPICE